jgi:hypothetical protein
MWMNAAVGLERSDWEWIRDDESFFRMWTKR